MFCLASIVSVYSLHALELAYQSYLAQFVPPFVVELDEEFLHEEESLVDGVEDSSASARLGGHLHLKHFRQFWESDTDAVRSVTRKDLD